MNKKDEHLVEARPEDFRKALAAATICLRQDRRFLGAPKLREHTAELAALTAMSGEFHSIGKAALERMDVSNCELYQEGMKVATDAAKRAIGMDVAG